MRGSKTGQVILGNGRLVPASRSAAGVAIAMHPKRSEYGQVCPFVGQGCFGSPREPCALWVGRERDVRTCVAGGIRRARCLGRWPGWRAIGDREWRRDRFVKQWIGFGRRESAGIWFRACAHHLFPGRPRPVGNPGCRCGGSGATGHRWQFERPRTVFE